MKLNCKCGWCVGNTYIWNINDNMVWIEIPKNATYNLKIARFYNKPDVKMQILKPLDVLKYKRGFTIIREPIERFKSLLSHYFIKGRGNHKEWLSSIGYDSESVSVDNICDIVLDNWDKIENLSEPHHFSSQASFIPNEFFEINHIVFELSESSLYLGLNKNFNSSDSFKIYISEENRKKILEMYKDDVELYQKHILDGRVQ